MATVAELRAAIAAHNETVSGAVSEVARDAWENHRRNLHNELRDAIAAENGAAPDDLPTQAPLEGEPGALPPIPRARGAK